MKSNHTFPIPNKTVLLQAHFFFVLIRVSVCMYLYMAVPYSDMLRQVSYHGLLGVNASPVWSVLMVFDSQTKGFWV